MSDGVFIYCDDHDKQACPECDEELANARRDLATTRRQLGERDAEVKELKRQLTFQRDDNHARNVEMDALHYVWCDGGCKSGTHRFTPGDVTEATVIAAERNTKRLRSWWVNAIARGNAAPTPAPADPVAAVLAVQCPICCARAGFMCVEYVSEYEVADARGICPERIRAAFRVKR